MLTLNFWGRGSRGQQKVDQWFFGPRKPIPGWFKKKVGKITNITILTIILGGKPQGVGTRGSIKKQKVDQWFS